MAKAHQSGKLSAEVTAYSDALELEPNVFKKDTVQEIAQSLMRSAEASGRRKTSAFRSAMLPFHVNRAGRNLSPERKQTLEAAKGTRPVSWRRGRSSSPKWIANGTY